jgi:inhibitor of Bruton tyrosine kinase
VKDAHISKITNCDDTFAALTYNGELFTFAVHKPGETDVGTTAGKERMIIKPQRIWTLRKKFSAVAVCVSFPSPP